MWWSHGYFHPILELKFYALAWSIWLHPLIRLVTIVVSGSMGRKPPFKRLFYTTCTKVVYCKTFILSIIIRPQIYPLLAMTLPFKESYILYTIIFESVKSQLICDSYQRKAVFPVSLPSNGRYNTSDLVVEGIGCFVHHHFRTDWVAKDTWFTSASGNTQ